MEKNKYYSKEEKLKYVQQMLSGRSCWEIEREEEIGHAVTNIWLKDYNKFGEKSLENKKKSGKESIKYPNIINNNWKATRQLEKITSDTTTIWFKKQRYDWTYYVDAFDDAIIGSDVKPFYQGVSMINHKNTLQDMLSNKIKRGYKSQDTIFHSDQGVIYSSVAFNNAHKDYNIIRSMSRIGTPTDNPVIESKKGWIKKEMYIDFNQDDYETVEDYINAIIYDRNYLRPSYALNYKTPIEYRTQLGFK